MAFEGFVRERDAPVAESDAATVAAPGVWADAPPPGLVDLRAVLPDACLEIRYATADNFTGAALPGYEMPGAWLREASAHALVKVQASLRGQGLSLRVFDAYRPRRATAAMVAWAEATGRTDLLAAGYIARTSRHAAGHTVDVGLCTADDGTPVDMGTPFDAFSPDSRHGAVAGAPGEARRTLRRAMESEGFEAYAREWWHYTRPGPGGALDVPYEAATR
jgi:D-alanyl-D-alanine dipeptidase